MLLVTVLVAIVCLRLVFVGYEPIAIFLLLHHVQILIFEFVWCCWFTSEGACVMLLSIVLFGSDAALLICSSTCWFWYAFWGFYAAWLLLVPVAGLWHILWRCRLMCNLVLSYLGLPLVFDECACCYLLRSCWLMLPAGWIYWLLLWETHATQSLWSLWLKPYFCIYVLMGVVLFILIDASCLDCCIWCTKFTC